MAKKKLTKEEKDLEVLDRAATCVVANSPEKNCEDNIKAFLCRIFWCASANPITRGDKNYKQSCADKLLTAYRAAKANDNPEAMGEVGGAHFYNSMRYVMKPIEQGKEPDYSHLSQDEQDDMKNRKKDNPEDYSLMNIDGRNQKCKIRTPDVSIYDTEGNLIAIFDFKFEGDTWHDGQLEDYRRLVNDGRERAYKSFVEEETKKSNAGQNEDPNSFGEYEKTNLRQTPDQKQGNAWKEVKKKDYEKITHCEKAVVGIDKDECKDLTISIENTEEQDKVLKEDQEKQQLKDNIKKYIDANLKTKKKASKTQK